MKELLASRGLDKEQLEEIKSLCNECLKYEKLNMKLNLDMLKNRSPSETNDFLCYENQQLIGFLGLYGFGPNPKEIELTGMVHPSYRRNGVFKALFNMARKECECRKTGRILLIAERASSSGIGFVNSVSAQYTFSEFRMKFSETAVPSFTGKGVGIRLAEPSDHSELKKLDALCFGTEETADDGNPNEEKYKTIYVIERNGLSIGKIGTLMEGEAGYIFGFAIKPEFQGQGFGREALSMILNRLLSENIHTVLLEVAVENDKALSLYTSCGFKEDTVYDYYQLKLMS